MTQTDSQILGEFAILRPLREGDAEITLRWRHGDRATLLNRGADNVEEQRAWIASRPKSEMNFIIETRKREPVGMLSLIGIDFQNRHAESARFLIGEEEKVKGLPIAVEAMKLLYELAFDRLELERIYGFVAEKNPLMVKWQKYLGMKEEGRLRRHYFMNGEFQDAICLGLLAEEYRKVSKSRMNVLIAAARKTGAGG